MKKKILVIDDEPYICKIIKKLLEFKGYEVDSINNPIEVNDIIEKFKYDLYIVDKTLEPIDGIEVIKLIKDRYPEVKVILMSGYLESEINDEKNYDSYIFKPDLSKELIKKVNELI